MNEKIISKLKKETNNSTYIIYREKYIKDIKIDIIFNETLTDSDKLFTEVSIILKKYTMKKIFYMIL